MKRTISIYAVIKEYRGLNPKAPLVLAEGCERYDLKVKRRTNKDGETIKYWVRICNLINGFNPTKLINCI